jgi:cation:H+ antiporter
MLKAWAAFALCVALIGYAGALLSRYGDVIAEKTGLGRTWVGLVLLATVTSLPEAITGISAVTMAGAPNIAIGDALGSCVFNLALILVLDYLHREESVYRRASQGHLLSAGFGVVLIGLVGFNLLLGARGTALTAGHIGLYVPVLIAAYLFAMRAVFRYEQAQLAEHGIRPGDRYPGVTLRTALVRYAGAAVIVVGAGALLPFVGTALARAMGWHETFVGTLFVAFATSAPELVVTIAAVRMGALDLAIGNLFGSNMFNMLIVAVDDMLYLRGPILADVSPLHAMSAMSAMIMTGVAAIGLVYRPTGRVFKRVGWTSIFIFSLYLMNTYVLYLHGE